MEKYFMAGTENELQFGDHIEVDLAKETKDGHIKHHHIDCVFCPELVEVLEDAGVIDVEEDEEEKHFTIDFSDDEEDYDDEDLDFLVDKLYTIEKRLSMIEEEMSRWNEINAKKRVKKDTGEKGK